MTIKIRLQSQPWHLFSGVIVRCILAASTLPHGREQAHKVMQAVADHGKSEFTDHAAGRADYGLRSPATHIHEKANQHVRAKLPATKVWEWKQNSGGAFANINRPFPARLMNASCRWEPIRSSYTHSARPTARR